jgi:hypothetical protein
MKTSVESLLDQKASWAILLMQPTKNGGHFLLSKGKQDHLTMRVEKGEVFRLLPLEIRDSLLVNHLRRTLMSLASTERASSLLLQISRSFRA